MNNEQRKAHFLEYLYCLLLLIFAIGRVGFMLYNRHIDGFGFIDVVDVLRTGLFAHDFMFVALLLAVPWLAALLSLHRPGLRLRALLIPYYILLGVIVGLVILADAVMYEFWQFKLNFVVFSYAASPEGTTNSVSTWFLMSRLAAALALILGVALPAILITPRRLSATRGTRLWYRNLSIIWTFLLLMNVFYMRVGDAYYSSRLFLNHSAVNPVLGFFSSVPWSGQERYGYLSDQDQAEAFQGLYPEETEDLADTLLNTRRPNVLMVFMESFGGKFVSELGGLPGVAPNMSRLIPQGIFWRNYYSNSFRTDRGTVSAYSGWVSYPQTSLMREARLHQALSSLPAAMEEAGYQTSYLYPGPMTNMGKRDYLADMHFRNLMDHTSFRPQEITSSWGADDSTSAMKTFHLIAQKDTLEPWFMVWQTISSHEPWHVPYSRLQDPVLNAFAYTDHCVGQLVDSLRTLPQWNNLLVILIPDHGYLYRQSYEDPEFFHSPMLWLGGAVREPRRMDVLMNQSDLAATLLGQLGLPHRQFPWSRNVLSCHYTYPFVYCNFPSGLMLRDSTGVSIFDLSAGMPILEEPEDGGLRERRAKAILQESCHLLGAGR
ncbi:MAG: LTA synthase family protein [Bacteroidaceae bacterium]|nr:LTA synthase family protein [Bacteroidaceae bacterium]